MTAPPATAPEITSRGYRLVFCIIGLSNMWGPMADKFVAEHYKDKTVAILYNKQQYGGSIATEVRKTMEDAGIKVAVFEGLNAGDKDLNVLISKLKRAGVQFVYFDGYRPEMGLLLCQAKQTGLDVRFMGSEGVGSSKTVAIIGDVSEGMLAILPRAFEQDSENKALINAFKAKNQDPSDTSVLPAYSAVTTIARGIERTDEANLEKVATALRASTFEIPTGNFGFDGKSDLKSFDFTVCEWHKDATRTEVR